jgi:hypothetical protein
MNGELDREELFRLFGGLSNETLTESEHGRLEEILAASVEARRLWFLYCDMERGLARRKSEAVLEAPNIHPMSVSPSRTRFRTPWAWALAASVVFAALIGGLVFMSQSTASAAAVVQRALKVHAALLDRCYRVEVRGERDGASPPRWESLLWTRGDRFWNQLQSDGKTVAWGRDEAGGVWFALSPKVGARLAANEVPEPLQTACDLRSVQMESLLREILAGYNLHREPTAADVDLIHAEPKPGNKTSRYGAALLEVDAHTHVLRRVELQRTHQGRAVATVSFTLVESSLQDDARYTLEGHLDADGAIYDRTSGRGQRGPVIAEFLRLNRVR